MLDDPDHKDNLLIRYLLNETSQEENEEIEDEMVLHEGLADRLEAVETLIIDRYVLREMSATDRLRFQRGFLLFPENQTKVDDARIFHRALDEFQNEEPVITPKTTTWFPIFVKWPYIRLPAFAALALLLIAAAFLIYRSIPSDEPNPLVNAPANAPPNATRSTQDNSNPLGPDRSTMALSSSPVPLSPSVRPTPSQVTTTLEEKNRATGEASGGSANVPLAQPLAIPRNSKTVTLSMELKITRIENPNERVPVTILTEKLQRVPGLRIRITPTRISKPSEPDKYVLRINVPARILKDNEVYYFAIPNPSQPDRLSITAFKVVRTKN